MTTWRAFLTSICAEAGKGRTALIRMACILLVALSLCACGSGEVAAASAPVSGQVSDSTLGVPAETAQAKDTEPDGEESILKIAVDEFVFRAQWEDNASARAFEQLLAQGPVTIEMRDYGGFEKVGELGTELVRSDTQITTQPGDVILYQGNQITIYYGTNSWNFTRLARIEDAENLKEKLGNGTVEVTFSLE